MSDLHSPAQILRRGYLLACQFEPCPVGVRRALEAAAEHAEAKDGPVSEDHSAWKGEPHFQLAIVNPPAILP